VFFKAVTDKYGYEKAMELVEDAFRIHGTGYEIMLKDNFPNGVDLKALGTGFIEELTKQGFTSELVVKDDSNVIIRNTKCPRYDGLKMVGFSDDQIEEYCTRCVAISDMYMKKAEPNMRFWISTWDAPNGRCDEEFLIKKP
jgi:hypothetical protein